MNNKNRLFRQTILLTLLGLSEASVYNTGQANSAFYYPSNESQSLIPSQCISSWDIGYAYTSTCRCSSYASGPPTMMINPNTITPSFYLKTVYGEFDSSNKQHIFQVTFQDLYSANQVVGPAAGDNSGSTNPSTHTFGPQEVIQQIGNEIVGGYFKRWVFAGATVVPAYGNWPTSSSPALATIGSYNQGTQCVFSPTGPIIGVRSYLNLFGQFCGVDFAYNQCACASSVFELTNYSLKTINWQVGNPPATQAWTISNSITDAYSSTSYSNLLEINGPFSVSSGIYPSFTSNCGNFLLAPVTTIINGYTPVSIVTAGFITSTLGNPSSITVTSTDHTLNGTFNVLLQVTNPSGYTITGDTSLYFVTPLYFFVTVVISCTPTFTLTTHPESPFEYLVNANTYTLATTAAIQFTDSNGCGIVPTYSCKIGGNACPLWITINASNQMTVNTNNYANIGPQTVSIQASYVSQSSVTVTLPSTAWVLNVKECIPAFILTTQPESPVTYTVQSVSIMLTTINAILFTDTNSCGIVPTYSCMISGAPCPSWININAFNQMTVNTNSPANLGQYIVNFSGTYFSQLSVTVPMPPTAWVINVNLCTPNFVVITQPESPFDYTLNPVSYTLTTISAIQFNDSNSCGITPTYSCKQISGAACPLWITIDASNKMSINTNSPANIGQYTVNFSGDYVSSLGATVALPQTAWVLNVLCIPAFKLTSQPESPVDFRANSQNYTTTGSMQFTDSNSCGINPVFSCKLSNEAPCPPWIFITSSNKMTVITNSQTSIGAYIVSIQATYVLGNGASVALPNTTWVVNILIETGINPCQKTIISQKDKQIPQTIPVTLTKLVDRPFQITLPQVSDSYSDSLNKFQACGPFSYVVRGGSKNLVHFEKNNLTITFESLMQTAVAGKYFVEISASLQRYPMIPALVFPFVYTLLDSNKTQVEASVNQTVDFPLVKAVKSSTTSSKTHVGVQIKSIDQLGNVIIAFGKRMLIGDIQAIQDDKFTKDGMDVPAFEVLVVPGPDSNPELLRYSYNITSMKNTTMTLKLNFENPIEVSAFDFDSLKIIFNDPTQFQGDLGETIKEGTQISRQIPPQLKNGKMTFLLADVKKFLTPSAQGFSLAHFTLNMILAATLQQLWSMINAQQIIVLMIAYDIKPPATASYFFNILFQIESVDVIPWSDYYDAYLEMQNTEPMSLNLDALGYGNMYFIYNLGSSILPIALLPVKFVLWFLFSRCRKVKCFNYLSLRLEKYLFWNGTITVINESFSVVIFSALISISALKWSTRGEIFSSSLGMLLLFFYSLYPFAMMVVYLKKFDQLEELSPKIGCMYEGIRLKSGRITVLLQLFHFIRRAIQAFTILWSREFYIQFISQIYTVQIQLMIICHCNPYDSVEQRRMELFNETMVTFIMYTVICFTDFMPDLENRYQIGFVSILLICIHFTVNIAILLKNNYKTLFFTFKRFLFRIQYFRAHQKKINQIQIKPKEQQVEKLVEQATIQFNKKRPQLISTDQQDKNKNRPQTFQSDQESQLDSIWYSERNLPKPKTKKKTTLLSNQHDDNLISFRGKNNSSGKSIQNEQRSFSFNDVQFKEEQMAEVNADRSFSMKSLEKEFAEVRKIQPSVKEEQWLTIEQQYEELIAKLDQRELYSKWEQDVADIQMKAVDSKKMITEALQKRFARR